MSTSSVLLAPTNTKVQNAAAIRYNTNHRNTTSVPAVCIVTGGTGFVGLRLVEMLVERGAQKVVSFDIVPPPPNAWHHPNIEYRIGDITNYTAIQECIQEAIESVAPEGTGKDIDCCVWHNAAAVGPFHPKPLYYKVNYEGTLNVIQACKECKVHKVVMSSSPSTRFDGSDVDGLTEAEMPALPLPNGYLQTYAETKAMGELVMLNEQDQTKDGLLTVAVAPHQVYGPRDNLFLPNLLEAAGNGKLRVFGNGRNKICFTHVDNYAHGLIIAERALYEGSPACGKFYIVTDGTTHPNGEQYLIFWKILDEAIIAMNFTSLWSQIKLPKWLLFGLAGICEALGKIFRTTFKLNYFNVLVLTMHRWFDIAAAEKDLNFTPIIDFREGWDDTIVWFRNNWLPNFNKTGSLIGLSSKTQDKIDIQAGGNGGVNTKKSRWNSTTCIMLP